MQSLEAHPTQYDAALGSEADTQSDSDMPSLVPLGQVLEQPPVPPQPIQPPPEQNEDDDRLLAMID